MFRGRDLLLSFRLYRACGLNVTSVILHDLSPEQLDCLLCLPEVGDGVEGVLGIFGEQRHGRRGGRGGGDT